MCETDLCHKTAKREFRKERIAVTAREIGVSRNFRDMWCCWLKELEKEGAKPISTTMDEWIHNQGWLTSCTYIHIYSNKFQKGMIFNKNLLKK